MVGILGLGVASIIGSGGGDGGTTSNSGGGSGTVISNLWYTPNSAQAGSGNIMINGGIDFETTLDITTLMLTDSEGRNYVLTLTGASGVKAGSINIPGSPLPTDTVGFYSFTIWVVDSAGNESNKLKGNIAITPTIPIANAGANQVVPPGTTVYLDGSGSTNADVLSIQGTPVATGSSLGTDTWHYDNTDLSWNYIEFSAVSDTVTGWNNRDGILILQ